MQIIGFVVIAILHLVDSVGVNKTHFDGAPSSKTTAEPYSGVVEYLRSLQNRNRNGSTGNKAFSILSCPQGQMENSSISLWLHGKVNDNDVFIVTPKNVNANVQVELRMLKLEPVDRYKLNDINLTFRTNCNGKLEFTSVQIPLTGVNPILPSLPTPRMGFETGYPFQIVIVIIACSLLIVCCCSIRKKRQHKAEVKDEFKAFRRNLWSRQKHVSVETQTDVNYDNADTDQVSPDIDTPEPPVSSDVTTEVSDASAQTAQVHSSGCNDSASVQSDTSPDDSDKESVKTAIEASSREKSQPVLKNDIKILPNISNFIELAISLKEDCAAITTDVHDWGRVTVELRRLLQVAETTIWEQNHQLVNLNARVAQLEAATKNRRDQRKKKSLPQQSF